jgi:transcription-repair coupling factor (superfamily II helicase)
MRFVQLTIMCLLVCSFTRAQEIINLPESKQITLARLYPGSLYKSASSTVLVALPKSSAWNPSESTAPIVDTSLLAWVTQAVTELAPTSKGSS